MKNAVKNIMELNIREAKSIKSKELHIIKGDFKLDLKQIDSGR